MTDKQAPWATDEVYITYTLRFVYACVIYSIIGFTWGALMGGISDFRHFVDHRLHGNLIVRAHTHINLLGWVEMAIFAAVYYIIPRLVKRPIYSIGLVKAHFWIHNVGLIGMVVFFSVAGYLGGVASQTAAPDQLEAIVKPWLRAMGISGTLVLLANFIWAYNIYKTCAGRKKAA
ncbi:MAG: cbb3-type cytochrome c oxidase subunit I [Gammaproteobacteria bacterium]|nr:cbb3-type cytochrome c oxidase subunit I [Gammaproteobacteria bacterium]